MLACRFGDAPIPAVLRRVVAMGDDQGQLEAGLEQHGEAADAYVAVAEDDRSCCHESEVFLSSTACTR